MIQTKEEGETRIRKAGSCKEVFSLYRNEAVNQLPHRSNEEKSFEINLNQFLKVITQRKAIASIWPELPTPLFSERQAIIFY